MLAGAGRPAGSGLGRPAPLPERGPPPAHRPRAGTWRALRTRQGEETPRGAGAAGAALGVPEPPPNFSPRGLTSGGRRSGAGRGERSFWKEPPPLLNMASSASSSLAGAESTPPAQVSAAPPPYLWLPARRGRAGGPGRGSREPEGRARAGAPPGALLSWGCRAEPARRAEGTRSLRPLGVRLRPRARDRSCGRGQRRELAVRPGARASIPGKEGGPEPAGLPLGNICLEEKRGPVLWTPSPRSPVFGLLCCRLAPPTPCQAEPVLRTRAKSAAHVGREEGNHLVLKVTFRVRLFFFFFFASLSLLKVSRDTSFNPVRIQNLL